LAIDKDDPWNQSKATRKTILGAPRSGNPAKVPLQLFLSFFFCGKLLLCLSFAVILMVANCECVCECACEGVFCAAVLVRWVRYI